MTTEPERRVRPLIAALAARAGVDETRWQSVLGNLLRPPVEALPVAPATDRTTWGEGGSVDEPTARWTLTQAETERSSPWPLPLASQAARVHRDGEREVWESLAFERQHRLSRATIAAALTLDDEWIDEVADGVQLLCEQSSWCWPAHDDSYELRGSVLATTASPFLDLGAGEVAGQLAWIDHLLDRPLDIRYPGLRARIRDEVRARVIDPFLERRDWHWIGLDGNVHNWNPWIHGNVVVAALRLLDAPEESSVRVETIALALDGIDRYVAALPPDGAIDEGFGYWWNGACRALEALDVLSFATGGVLDPVADIPALRQTVAFPHRNHLGGPWYVNFSDGQARPTSGQPWHALHRAARRVGDADAAAHAASHRIPGTPSVSGTEGLGRQVRGMTDRAWSTAYGKPPLPKDVVLTSIETLLSRMSAGSSDGLTLVAKGGHNGENHNHNDVGTFIVAIDGVPIVVDAGRPTYTKQTFGPNRYDMWTMQSTWHNVPQVRGAAQPAGRRWSASDVQTLVGAAASSQQAELAGAYDVADLNTWRRSVRLDRDEARVKIEDAWQLAGWDDPIPEPRTTVHLLLAGKVQLLDGGAQIEALESGAAAQLTWPTGVPARLDDRPLNDPFLSDVWGPHLTRLVLDVTGRTDLVVEIRARPARPAENTTTPRTEDR